mmetsp:Transcript_27423/g.77191  ORF Transcript_27423/g.77191 Transcript_27423/m.77191 type:complete len:123 (+) Transcript_27423:149-517(+)
MRTKGCPEMRNLATKSRCFTSRERALQRHHAIPRPTNEDEDAECKRTPPQYANAGKKFGLAYSCWGRGTAPAKPKSAAAEGELEAHEIESCDRVTPDLEARRHIEHDDVACGMLCHNQPRVG